MNEEMADYMKLKACWWLHVQGKIRVKINKAKENKKMAPNISFDNKYIIAFSTVTNWQANADDI